MQKQLTNARRAVRSPASLPVFISWTVRSGDPQFAIAKGRDISEGGISLRVNHPIPVHSFVQLQSVPLQLAGTGTVRYCRRGNDGYSIGLEFTGGMKYTLQQGGPRAPGVHIPRVLAG